VFNPLTDIAYGNGQYVAVGPDGFLTSADNTTNWTLHPFGSGFFSHIACGNGQFVTVGSEGRTFASPDAATWTLRSYITTSALNGVAYGQDQFVAVGAGGAILSLRDAGNWVVRQAETNNYSLNSVAYGNGWFVAVGGSGQGTNTQSTMVVSTNGSSWTPTSRAHAGPLASVAYGNGQFVAVGAGTAPDSLGTIPSSSDGVDWTPRSPGLTNTHPDLLGFSVTGVAYGNGQFVAAASATYQGVESPSYFILSSPGGIHWTPREAPDAINDISYANGKFVAGSYKAVLSSSDSVQWTRYATDYGIAGMAYGYGQFVAVGFRTLLSSPDALNWTRRSAAAAYALHGIAYGNHRFVAVGDNGTILESGLMQLQCEPLSLRPGGLVQGMVTGLPATNCVIQVSTNLSHWAVLTNLTTITSSAPFSDPSATSYSRRFYRAKAIAQ
jgi:hypothetical protein